MVAGGTPETARAIPGGDPSTHESVAVQLRAERQRLGFLLSATSALTYSCQTKPPFGATFVSENVNAILGYAAEEFIRHGTVTGMNGSIDVERADRGTTFRVTLPPGRPHESEARTKPRRQTEATPRGRVLVIDDTEAMGATLHVVLDGSYDVTAVTRAKDAIELIGRGEAFDVILCDVMMPDMSGIELFAHVSRAAPTIAARMVFMTGGTSEATRAFLERGPNDWLEKPFESAALFELLGKKMAGR